MKQVLGIEGLHGSRYKHLAFAMGIGMAYRRVEYSTRQDNQPDPVILMRQFKPWVKGEDQAEVEALVADARAWLEVPASPELVAKHEAARAAFFAAKNARTVCAKGKLVAECLRESMKGTITAAAE
jgi:mannitol-1-phosphate/altronate dehydrogenase